MEFQLYDLPPEQLEPIYDYCHIADLLNVACASKAFYESVIKILWKVVGIPWRSLSVESFQQRRLENLKYTKKLCFNAPVDVKYSMVKDNFDTILDNCEPNKLRIVNIDGVVGDEGFSLLCRKLYNVEAIIIKGCEDISSISGWTNLNDLEHLKKLTIYDSYIYQEDVQKIIMAENLEELVLGGRCKINKRALKEISKLLRLRKLNIRVTGHSCLQGLKYFQNIKDLEELEIDTVHIDDIALENISHLQKLKKFVISGSCDNEITSLSPLCGMDSLKTLSIQRCNITRNVGFIPLTELNALQYLDLSNSTRLSDNGLSVVSELTNLREMHISNCEKVSDIGLDYLSKLAKLEVLDVSHCSQITDIGLFMVAKLKNLYKLNLGWCIEITDTALNSVRKLTKLKELDLFHCRNLTNKGLKKLAYLTQLEYLNISNVYNITDEGLQILEELNALRYLDMHHCRKITDQGLSHLNSLTSLLELDMRELRQITDLGLANIAELSSLSKLRIADCYQVTDQGLCRLQRRLKYLRMIDIQNCDVTNVGIFYLSKMSFLKEIWITASSCISAHIQADYPQIYFKAFSS